MATYNTSFIVNAADLSKILDQIKVAERDSGRLGPNEDLATVIGQDAALLPVGLRTVDGSNNHLLPGQSQVGAADQLFPRLLTPEYRNLEPGDATTNGDTITLPGGGPTLTNNDYNPLRLGSHSVVDADPRTISNLISDQTLNNQSALNAALLVAGSSNIAADTVAINAAFVLTRAAVALADEKQHTETEYENAKASATLVDTAATDAKTALTTLLAGVAPLDPVDADDLAASAAAVAAANAAVAAQLLVVKALQSDIHVAPADLSAAQTLLTDLQGLKVAADGIASALVDGTVDPADFASIQAAEASATTVAGTATANLGTLTSAEAAAEVASNTADADKALKATSLEAIVTVAGLEVSADGSITIEARSPDIGLSPANSGWMTFFGQFFDHGLDLVTKGGNGTIYMPLSIDDPLYDFGRDGVVSADDGFGADGILSTADDSLNFMALSRATPFRTAGADGVLGNADDIIEAQNTTTPFVDQNQTYTSAASHQVFLREYAFDGAGHAVNTGKLLNGVNGGIANWAEVKLQAATMLGIKLTDFDVHNVPKLVVDDYGRFIPGANGFAQIETLSGIIEGVAGGLLLPTDTIRTGHAFLNDISHHAAPSFIDHDHNPATPSIAQIADSDTGDVNGDGVINASDLVADDRNVTTYDDEMLNAHFITGDGRGNENIGLTAVHTIFHSEHNRLVDANKATILATAASGDVTFLNEWLATDVVSVPADLNSLVWDGERLFQAARFVTEMQYQHLVFEEFARRVQPNVDPFVFTNSADLNPAIVAEFAHAVYRFGHSQLTDTVDRLDNDLSFVNSNGAGDDANQIGLIEAFLNPQEFSASGIDDEAATGAIIRGMSRQVGNEIDEFVVDALRNNLLGLPLDLPALNIARGREQGIPSLNDARAELYAMTGAVDVKPYTSWIDFAQHIKHPMSIVNFIAAYGKHAAITSAVTLDEKRAAATLLVLGDGNDLDGVTIGGNTYFDRKDFLNSNNGVTAESSGLNDVDMWIGGLAEEINEFGGMLGSTFNFVFEYQMEHLQNGDRFYYLSRTQGMNLLNLLEPNTFTDLIMRNTDLGDIHSTHLSAEIMEVPDMILELDRLVHQENYSGNSALDGQDPLDRSELDVKWDDPFQQAIEDKVTRVEGTIRVDGLGAPVLDAEGQVIRDGGILRFSGGEHVVLGGTEGNDTLTGDKGIDTLWGDGGNDYLNAGMESDQVYGGDGDDIIEDPFGDDFLRGEAGDDVIVADQGIDLLFGGEGQDFIMGVTDMKEVFAGPGNDFILGGSAPDGLMGNEGDDWIEGGEGFDGLSGENSELFFNSLIVGHDILNGQGNDTDYDGENGDDIMVQSNGIQRNNGMDGFDWGIHKGDTVAADSDLGIRIFDARPALILRDRFDSVEGLSGWKLDDKLTGAAKLLAGEGFDKTLTQAGVDRIAGLNNVIASVAAANPGNDPNAIILDQARADAGGEILLGGGGNDTIRGNLGDDIIDGDAWLNVRISVHQNKVATGTGPGNPELFSVDGLTSIVQAGPSVPSAWVGKQLADLMRTGVINPGQLQAVREILYDDATNGTNPADLSEDVAVFGDVQANYTITRSGDVVTVTHTTVTAGLTNDGIDTLRNVEFARFSDGDLLIVNRPPTGAAVLTDTTPTETQTLAVNTAAIADPNGIVPGSFTFQWQTSATGLPGSFGNIVGATGVNFTPVQANVNSFLRAVVSFTDGLGNIETVSSAPSARVVGDFVNGSLLGADTFVGTAGDDIANLFFGNDTAQGNAGDDRLDGGGVAILPGNDTAIFTGAVTNFRFDNNAANNIIVTDSVGNEGIDTLSNFEQLRFNGVNYAVVNGTAGPNINLNGGGGSDAIFGFAGNDTMNGGAGNDLVVGGSGDDTITYSVAPNAVAITSGRDIIDGGTNTATGDRFVLNGSTLAETFRIYTAAAATLAGITGFGVNTEIVVTRTVGATTNVIAELDNIEEITINGSGVSVPGNDPGGGTSTIPLGADSVQIIGDFNTTSLNFNTITVNGSTANDTVDVSALSSAHRIVFTSNGGADTIIGARTQDVLHEMITGTAANNTINAGNGNDTVNGLAGNDTFLATLVAGGTDGNDTYNGGDGYDYYDMSATSANANVDLNTGLAVSGQIGTDKLSSIEGVIGSQGNNILTGDGYGNYLKGLAGDDSLSGGIAADNLDGGDGNDYLDGGDHNDIMFGGAGNDTLYGGAGDDKLNGGTGNDLFGTGMGNDSIVLQAGFGNDSVNLFDANAAGGQDVLDISAFGITAATFASHVTLTDIGADVLVTIDGDVNQTIKLGGVANTSLITQSDFVLFS